MGSVSLEVVIIVVLVVFNGVLAGSELAIVSARRLRLEQRARAGNAGAAAALKLAYDPNRFLSTVQIGITMVGIFAGAFAGATLATKVAEGLEGAGVGNGPADALGVVLVVLGITYLSLVIGELVPKRIALQHPESIASAIARPMGVLAKVAAPAVVVLSFSTNAVLRVLHVRPQPESALTQEELHLLLRQSADAGVIEQAEHLMTTAVLELGNQTVEDLMTPRLEVSWLDATEPLEEALAVIAASPHEQFPVCSGDMDQVLGVVAVRDLFAARIRGDSPEITRLLRPALFLPEPLTVLSALEQFKQANAQLAIVIDEYGGTAGIVTLTDMLQALVGELPSDDGEEEPVVVRDDGSWLLDARIPSEVLRETIGVEELPDEHDYQTLAGFVLHEFGKIPLTGEAFSWGGFRFEVVDMDARRVDRVLVSREAPAGDDERGEPLPR